MASSSIPERQKRRFSPLLSALILFSAAAAVPPSLEKAWTDARAAIENGQSLQAVKIVDEALAHAPNKDSEQAWALRILKVAALTNLGRKEEVKPILDAPFPASLDKTATAVRRLIALGWYRIQFDEKGAIADLERARAIAEAHAPGMLAEALYMLGTATANTAMVEEAVRLAGKGGDPIIQVKAEISLFLTYTLAGRLAEAVKIAEPMQARVEALNLANLFNKYYGNAAWLYELLGDYEQAVSIYKTAESTFARAGQLTDRLTILSNLGDVHLYRRDLAAAERAYQQFFELVRVHRFDAHSSVSPTYRNLAWVKLESGNVGEARRIINLAIARERANGDAEGELFARLVEARIDLASGQYDKAQETLELVAAKIDHTLSRIEALGQLARVHAAMKRNALAISTFDSAVSAIREERDSITNPNLRFSVFNTAAELFDDYIDYLVSIDRVEDALRIAETSRAQTLAEGLAVAAPAKLDARAIARARKATILSYWLGRRHSYLWTITGKEIRINRLPRDTVINAAVARYRDDLRTARATLTETGNRGARLYEQLVQPAAIAPNSRVIVVPDRILHTLNFETLVVPGGERRYWIEDVTLANASSVQLLAGKRAEAGPAATMLVIGDPNAAERGFPALAQAPEEIARIRKHFAGAKLLTGAAATPTAYFAAKPETFQFVHFVAHGTASRLRPLDSAIILSPDPQRGVRLTAGEIAGRRLTARLVTISSCEGAGSATYAGEGLVGLAWAFRRAGAEQVIAALWEVTDRAAPPLMDRMYTEIRAGADPAAALRTAKLELLRSKSASVQPRHWAPFVIYQ